MICSIWTNAIHQNQLLMIENAFVFDFMCVCVFVYIYWHYFAFTFVHKICCVFSSLLNVILFIYLFIYIIYSKAFSVLKCISNGNQQKILETWLCFASWPHIAYKMLCFKNILVHLRLHNNIIFVHKFICLFFFFE